ncbi:MAG: hypothetical protein WD068_02130 [Candidatus Babeliales bacterium]
MKYAYGTILQLGVLLLIASPMQGFNALSIEDKITHLRHKYPDIDRYTLVYESMVRDMALQIQVKLDLGKDVITAWLVQNNFIRAQSVDEYIKPLSEKIRVVCNGLFTRLRQDQFSHVRTYIKLKNQLVRG